MRRLILLRHGKAEASAPSGGDAERGLTERGRRDSALMSLRLAQAGLAPDLVLVSAARRTRETWDEAAPAFPGAEVRFDPGLYLASAQRLSSAVAAHPESVCLMLVGHNPGLHELALDYAMALGAPLDRLDAFPTAAVAVFLQTDRDWTLEAVWSPRDGEDAEA